MRWNNQNIDFEKKYRAISVVVLILSNNSKNNFFSMCINLYMVEKNASSPDHVKRVLNSINEDNNDFRESKIILLFSRSELLNISASRGVNVTCVSRIVVCDRLSYMGQILLYCYYLKNH